MNGRKLFELYREAHGGETGARPGSFDDLSTSQRLVWARLADAIAEEQLQEIADASG